ncbi:MAG: ABC transporter substrate-binding protein [Proteobacteria bacterium]|nr:ABC transporter substrate-binding protein [Pseudomonadota bacterium]MBU4295536.1 ABC transporter substrate-binding protein [Pseudomonadota bacterium]MCG2748412.1 ABC transporter substrate-binding protein [Desulfobulbaceae bacterium]
MKALRLLLRTLLTFLFVISLAPELHAEKRIGVIMTGDVPYYGAMQDAFVAELNRRFAGVEKIEIILQRPFPDSISWSNAARKLIAFDVDLIVTYGSPATQAVIHEKSRIPLVYAGLYEPDQAGIVSKNVTGCGFKVPLSSIIRYFKRLKTVNTLGIVCSGIEEDSMRQYETMKAVAEQQNMKAVKIDIRSRADLDKLKTKKPDAVFITGSSLAHLWLEDIMSILRKEKIPTGDIFPDFPEAGVLMTLFQPPHQQGEMAAEMAAQILLGEKPANITAYTFRDTELVFNLVEARHLDISFPIHLLIEATKVIE